MFDNTFDDVMFGEVSEFPTDEDFELMLESEFKKVESYEDDSEFDDESLEIGFDPYEGAYTFDC